MIKYLPDDINIEDILSYLPRDSYRISISGLHKRNSHKDIIGYEEAADGKMEFHIGRNGLYDSLPEYMFHPINRFDNIPDREKKERFAEEYAKQESEKENAHQFFSPIDLFLLDIKTKVKDKINQLTSDNIIIQNIIGDTLTDAERSNRFIKRTLPFLPNCKQIRGNKTLITLMLRKVLFEEGLSLNKENIATEILDQEPQYNYRVEDSPIDSMYLGNEFCENLTTFTINYWSDEECSENFNQFLEELETYRNFIKDFFLSIEEELCFYITSDYPTLRLSDDIIYNYLNYNTNL